MAWLSETGVLRAQKGVRRGKGRHREVRVGVVEELEEEAEALEPDRGEEVDV
jgi:hypothetical protein